MSFKDVHIARYEALTNNSKGFPSSALEPHGITALTADAFVLGLLYSISHVCGVLSHKYGERCE